MPATDPIILCRVYFSLYSSLDTILLTQQFTILYGEKSGHWIHAMDESVRFGNPTFDTLFDFLGAENAIYPECKIAIKYVPKEYLPYVSITKTFTGEKITYDWPKMNTELDPERINYIETQYKFGVASNPNFIVMDDDDTETHPTSNNKHRETT